MADAPRIIELDAGARLYVYRWDRCGRKGQICRVTARGKMNSVRVVFDDGFTMISSGNALRRALSLHQEHAHDHV